MSRLLQWVTDHLFPNNSRHVPNSPPEQQEEERPYSTQSYQQRLEHDLPFFDWESGLPMVLSQATTSYGVTETTVHITTSGRSDADRLMNHINRNPLRFFPIASQEEEEDREHSSAQTWLRQIQEELQFIDWESGLPVAFLGEQATTLSRPGPGSGVSQATISRLRCYNHTQEMAAGRKDDTKCSICLGDVEIGQNVRVLTCEHEFHAPCVDKWLLEKPTCPMCRSALQR